jgi:hypothetical protein
MDSKSTKTILLDNNFSKWDYDIRMLLNTKNLLKTIKYPNFDEFLLAFEIKYSEEQYPIQRLKWYENDEAARG